MTAHHLLPLPSESKPVVCAQLAQPSRSTKLQLPPLRPIFCLFGSGTGSTSTSWSPGNSSLNQLFLPGLWALDIRHIVPDLEPKWTGAASSGGRRR
ncbi:hypothetical protein DVH24_025790 [Malus domestica]|uniref:Uncharacterized protein n=1 Tax=Malus domestica TaxID=3750 RepID=A0A498KJR8_MALDO|nr:hypothetical protein DVH24_025790 [Malus domestica]